jgi:hypothetical protein
MFGSLDDAYNRTLLKPRNLAVAVVCLFAVGVGAGILIGRRSWDLLEWLQVGFSGLVILIIFRPIFREFYNFLKDRSAESSENPRA